MRWEDGPGTGPAGRSASRRAGLTGACPVVGVADEAIRFELFEGTHPGVDYRYPLALAWLCQRIAG